MAESKDERSQSVEAEKNFRIRFLVRETGITEAQARELIDLIGFEVSSLLREACLLKKR